MYNSRAFGDRRDADEALDVSPLECIEGDPYAHDGVMRSVSASFGGYGIDTSEDFATRDEDPFNTNPIVMRNVLDAGWAEGDVCGFGSGADPFDFKTSYLEEDGDTPPPRLRLHPPQPGCDSLGRGEMCTATQKAWPVFSTELEPKDQPIGGPLTTITVHRLRPSTLANSLCDFFQQLASNLEDFNLENFALQVLVFLGAMSCLVEARVFKSPGSGAELKVEFSRPHGDGVVFSRVFREASHYLKERFPNNCMDAVVPLFPTHMPPPPPATEDEDEDTAAHVNLMLAPWNTLPSASLPEAETIAELALVAATASGAKHIETAVDVMEMDLGDMLAGLVSSNRIEVAYQGARLAKHLVMHVDTKRVTAIRLAAEACLCRGTTEMVVCTELRHLLGGS